MTIQYEEAYEIFEELCLRYNKEDEYKIYCIRSANEDVDEELSNIVIMASSRAEAIMKYEEYMIETDDEHIPFEDLMYYYELSQEEFDKEYYHDIEEGYSEEEIEEQLFNDYIELCFNDKEHWFEEVDEAELIVL